MSEKISDTVRDMRARARKGEVPAMVMLAEWYYIGAEGLDKSRIKSFEWLLKAAEHGDMAAQNAVGGCYETGDGVSKDPDKALEWYSKAYDSGHADVCCNIGILYEMGIIHPQDAEKAVKYYEEGVTRGSAGSQYRLGQKLLFGHGVKQDAVRGAELLDFAGQAGYGGAYETLGYAYLAGNDLPRNAEKGFGYLAEAFKNLEDPVIVAGNAPLLYALCLLTGTGCKKDRKAALDALEKASTAGSPVAEQVMRDYTVRDPGVFDLFWNDPITKKPQNTWDISTLLLSKFA